MSIAFLLQVIKTYNLIFRYKNKAKTDIKQTWVKHPKKITKETRTMGDIFPPTGPLVNYR